MPARAPRRSAATVHLFSPTTGHWRSLATGPIGSAPSDRAAPAASCLFGRAAASARGRAVFGSIPAQGLVLPLATDPGPSGAGRRPARPYCPAIVRSLRCGRGRQQTPAAARPEAQSQSNLRVRLSGLSSYARRKLATASDRLPASKRISPWTTKASASFGFAASRCWTSALAASVRG